MNMLPGHTVAVAAAIGVLSDALPSQSGFALLTAPQHDARRARSSFASVSVSGDGRYVAFTSYARLSPADVDSLADIYVLDRSTTTVTLESASVEGRPVNSDCSYPRLARDGRYLVFEALLGDGPDRSVTDLVLRDRVENTARRITMGAGGIPSNGWSGQPAIVANGSAVVFASTATNLTAERDLNGTQPDIYRFDVATDRIERISVDSTGVQRPGGSVMPGVSGDGRYVVFSSGAILASSRDAADQPLIQGRPTIYIRDTRAGQTRLVGSGREAPNDASTMPAISADGRFVVFSSRASNLAGRDRKKFIDVFLYDVDTAVMTLVSRRSGGAPANGDSLNPAISADGIWVVFQSDASDLGCTRDCPPGQDDINLLPDIFLFNRTTGGISCVSVDRQGTWLEESGGPAVDAAGAVLAFTSRHPISARDVSHDFDLFVRIVAP